MLVLSSAYSSPPFVSLVNVCLLFQTWVRCLDPWQPFFKERQPVFTGFPGGSDGKELPAAQETWVQSLGWEAPLGKGMATHSSILAWRIPRREELVGYSAWGL